MGLKLIVNVPGAGLGDPVEVPGLGVFANGAEHEVDDERVQEAVASGMQPEELLGDNVELLVGVEGAELGPPSQAPEDEEAPASDTPPGPESDSSTPVESQGGDE